MWAVFLIRIDPNVIESILTYYEINDKIIKVIVKCFFALILYMKYHDYYASILPVYQSWLC